MKNQRIHFIAKTAVSAALICAGALVRIPLPNMYYMTLQLPVVLLVSCELGWRTGALASAVYIAAGLAGLPVFAAGGGAAYIFQPTFGYIAAFIPAACAAGIAFGKRPLRFPACFLAVVIVYTLGIAYQYTALNLFLNQSVPLSVLIGGCTFTFLRDIVVCVICAVIKIPIKQTAKA